MTDHSDSSSSPAPQISGHGGAHAVAAAQAHGARAMFTLSGAHVFPLYDGAVKAAQPLPLYDVRHEQTAVFAAEGTAKLTRTPGLAVLTAGPGVTNGVSGITSAHFNGSPLVVIGGRAPAFRWGTGALQELDQPPLLAPVTKRASTIEGADQIAGQVSDAFTLATAPHRGPVFLDVSMDHLFGVTSCPAPQVSAAAQRTPDPGRIAGIAAQLSAAQHPVLVFGSDVWTDHAEQAAAELATATGLPVVANGMARGVLPPSHPSLVTRARSAAFNDADLVVVVGTPLDFRLGYGRFGGKNGAAPARVIHVVDDHSQIAAHLQLADSVAGDLSLILRGLAERLAISGLRAEARDWATQLRAGHLSAIEKDSVLLEAEGTLIHPARVYGELIPLLAQDSVVIGDGGDFVSFAGKFIEPSAPGGWMDPGPYGCLGTGMGYAMAARLARPSSQVVLLMGDGAAGFSLMDVEALVRQNLPVVIVVGNNGIWGLEKHPMQMVYGYDVVAELTPQLAYHDVVTALGGAGELVTSASQIGPAIQRGFDSGTVYCVNVITDPAVAYARNTTGL